MTALVSVDDWSPLPGSVPETVDPSTVYVIPTRSPLAGDDDDVPRYTDHMRYFPKEARAAGAPVEFSMPVGSRMYLSEFSIDPEMWALGLAVLTMANEWAIVAVQAFIDVRARAQGWSTEEAADLPLQVKITETETGTNYKIEGKGVEVLEAMRILNDQKKLRLGGRKGGKTGSNG